MSRNGQGERRPVVLVVDDDPDLRFLANMQLSQGFDVLQAGDGPEALRLAAEHIPDVILLDMMMPGMDGTEVLNQLHNNPSTQDIPVIFLSALSATDDKVKGLEGGAIDWIAKPADPRELVARVGAAARVKARQDEIRVVVGGDPVTNLKNREAFETHLRHELARAARSSAPVSLMLVDVDDLEKITERFGGVVSDEVLRQVSDILKISLRAADELFRYADHEFAAVLPDTEVGTAYLAAERCREEIGMVEADGEPIAVSIGIAQHTTGRSGEELVQRAEIALFRAKESGGGRTWRADDPRRHGLNPIALSEELTEREWDVLVHLSHKRTEQEIARRLGITRGTVRSHKARIRRKLHVSPDVRLSDFVRTNFKDLINRLPVSAGPEQGKKT